MEKTDLSADETREILEALTLFKALFPKSSFKAGTALVLTKQTDGSLKMEYQVVFYWLICLIMYKTVYQFIYRIE